MQCHALGDETRDQDPRAWEGGAREHVTFDMQVRVDGDMRVNLDNTAGSWMRQGCGLEEGVV